MNDHMFFLSQEIFLRAYVRSDLKGDVPELACVAIKAAHDFCSNWDRVQEILEGESQKAVEASTAIVAAESEPDDSEPEEEKPPGYKRPAAKRKRLKK
jgi:hypothetical protein